MKKFLAIWMMFFGTATMAENITLVCTPSIGYSTTEVYIRFNDEEQTITQVFNESYLSNNWYDNVIHWSDKIIIFTDISGAPTNTQFLVSLSALDRVKGRLQTVYASTDNFDREEAGLYLYECELHDRENPKF